MTSVTQLTQTSFQTTTYTTMYQTTANIRIAYMSMCCIFSHFCCFRCATL